VAQGERFPIRHVPDTERDCACPTGGRVCGQAISLAVLHPREEPDALKSARPGLCGGHRATGVPTAINSKGVTRQYSTAKHFRWRTR
jgi:hypothetical protein